MGTWCGGQRSRCADGELTTAEDALELAHGCVACTVRNDLLVVLRKLHRCDGVDRIVVHLAPWLEPEPICVAIEPRARPGRSRLRGRPGCLGRGDRGGGDVRRLM